MLNLIPPRFYIYGAVILITVGAFFWFRHTFKQDGKIEARAECVQEKNDTLQATITNSNDTKKDREKTDDEVRKMPLSDVDRELLANGWMRRT